MDLTWNTSLQDCGAAGHPVIAQRAVTAIKERKVTVGPFAAE
jgi:hypothetical protein